MSAENDGEFASRTKKKQHVEELQKLGAALVALAPAQLAALAIPPELLDAVREAQRITSHEAKRRQVQFIGKVMRKLDPEPVPAARAQQRRLESWRERLIGGDGALTEYASAHPGTDLQALRTLVRNARKEIAEAKPPRAQRELFRLLRETGND